MGSVGQQRMSRLHGGHRDKLKVGPNVSVRVGLVRGGAGSALVGDPEAIAGRMTDARPAAGAAITLIKRERASPSVWLRDREG